MQTSDRVPVSDGLRVWALPRLEPGTVDLETPVAPPQQGEWLLVHLDRGRSELVVPTTVTALTATLDWSWADPIIALGIAAVAVREGRSAWRGEDCC